MNSDIRIQAATNELLAAVSTMTLRAANLAAELAAAQAKIAELEKPKEALDGGQ